MATWTFNCTVGESFGVRHPAYLDAKIYFIDSLNYIGGFGPSPSPGGDIYEIDPTGPTKTLILDASAILGGLVDTVWSLASFQGDLYAAVKIDNGGPDGIEGLVLRWDGTPGNWTEVFSTGIGVANCFDRYIRLYAQDDVIIYYGRDWVENSGQLFYSANGSSWTAGSITNAGDGSNHDVEFDFTVYWPLGVYEYILTGPFSTSSTKVVDVFDGSDFVEFQASPADTLLQSSPNGDVHFGGGGFYKLSLDMSTADLLDANIGALMLMNATGQLIGADKLTATTQLYTFDGSNSWISLETMSPNGGVDPLFDSGSGWIANGPANAWLLAKNDSTGNWELWERDESFSLTTELRHLGLGADQANLYLTANDAGTLKCFAYNLDTLTLVNTASLGAATFVEVEDRTRGIFPVARPGADGIVFLRGRDGNNVAVQRSDDSGATFADKDDGGWATTKYVVGLLIDPLHPDDLIAVFDDNDIYQSTDEGETWSKIADAPATLRAAARHLTTPQSLLLAAQAADTIYNTNNLGLTTEDVSDAALNTINVIEVSR